MGETMLDVTGMSVSHGGRVITLTYTRAPEPDEAMDARRWEEIRQEYLALARAEIARHGRTVEVYGAAPECSDWMLTEISP